MRIIIDDSIKIRECPKCYSIFIYEMGTDTYNTFDKKGKPTLMIECPHCRKSLEEQYSNRLNFIIDRYRGVNDY